ncbi:MAG TPA: hypothetical protein VG675_12600 [Bryobacteraceae bacterium]|nr:hypothetical protein [Bryobacteraceae bacterium]
MNAAAAGINARYFQQDSPLTSSPNQGLTNWNQDIPRKAPQRQGALIDIGLVQDAFNQNRQVVTAEIDDLKRLYLFSDVAIDTFLEDHSAIRSVLRQAVDPLRMSFGPDRLVNLEVSTDEDGSSTLYAVVIWQADVPSASGALINFLESWWLQRMNGATSDLAFAYKLV